MSVDHIKNDIAHGSVFFERIIFPAKKSLITATFPIIPIYSFNKIYVVPNPWIKLY